MKTIKKSLLLLGVVAFLFTSCVQNLDVVPNDPNNIQYFDQNGVFTKIYATLATTGQNGPDGNGDVEGIDEGVSAFVRMIWELQEFPTDEGWWIWGGDAGLPDVRVISWTAVNPLISGIYYRLYFDVSLCNHFLQHATAEGDGAAQIAEVRFIRALNYYYLLDMFGSVPFTLEVSEAAKPQYTRQQLFEWLETELKQLEDLLPAARLNDYRVDKVAAQMLLARMYLTAEVYTGSARWADAEAYADKVMSSSYKLHKTSTSGIYSAYQELFMGDNHKFVGGTGGEGILNIYQDGVMTQCWGGARFLCSAFRDANYNYFGSDDTWSCFRSSPEFVEKWTDLATAATIFADEFEMPAIMDDDRAIMRSANVGSTDTCKLEGSMKEGAFYECWSVLKWTGRYSTQPIGGTNIAGHDPHFPDTDIPFMRVAEAYMTKAEALYHQGKVSEALGIINDEIRARANAEPLLTLDDQTLCDEWCREFYCEGRRRIDLIRLGFFAGPKADANGYTWEGRGSVKSGGAFVSLDKKYNIFPLPNSDVVVQGLKQAEGY